MAAVVEVKDFYKHFNQALETSDGEVGHFNIFKVEDLDPSSPGHKPITYSRRNFYKVSLVTGESNIHYADHSVHIADHVLVFTNPMIPFSWERISEKHSGYVCIFTKAFFNRFTHINDYPVFQSARTGVVPLKPEEFTAFNALFSRMYEELNGHYAFKYDLLRNLLMEAVHSAQKLNPAIGTKTTVTNASERITGLFAELLERQFPIELSNQMIRIRTASAFAKQLNIHVNHLNKALKEITGKTTSQLINDRVFQEAKILLKSTNWTINEIAWGLGFEEPNHFSSFFKTKANITPKAYRQTSN